MKRMSPQKYNDLSIAYYFDQNSKLGPGGKPQGIVSEKSFEDILAGKGFRDRYLRVEPGQRDLHPCFFFCSGKYQYYANLINDIRKDMWH